MLFKTKNRESHIPTFIIESNHYLYRRALKREMGIWRNSNNNQNFLEEEFDNIRFSYLNNNYVFKCNNDWIKFLTLFGPFKKALVLGGNKTGLEEYLLKNKIVENIENLDIIHKGSNSIIQFADLNFAELKKDTYDLVIAKSILHHIINLEHLLLEVNHSLKPNGKLVAFEYIGENKQQWTQYKIDLINKNFQCNDIIPKYVFNKLRHNLYNEWPFESIRSQNVPEVIENIFPETKIIEIRWGKLNWAIKYHISQYCFENRIKLERGNEKILADRAEELDKFFYKDKKLLPCYLFGIYSKSTKGRMDIHVDKWDNKKINSELALRGPIMRRIKSFISSNKHTIYIQFLLKIKSALKFLI
jgi:SAM-dependent methyltransferase